jgi:hypothetical protein
MQPGFSRACAPRGAFAGTAGLAWMPASIIPWVCEANPKLKNGTEAIFEQRKGLEGFSHAVGGTGAIAEPRKARFFAEQKMRKND